MTVRSANIMMKKYNTKVIVLLSALCCVLIAGVSLYQKSRRTMDIIVFMGQSNMGGANGDVKEVPELTEGAGYEYRAVADPSTLYVLTEPFGEKENRGALDDTEIMERQGSLVTAFVNAYYEETGTPVVAVSASRGSSSVEGWLNRGMKEEAGARLDGAKECLEKEKIHIRHIYMVWFQGEADVNLKTTQEEYETALTGVTDYMKEHGVEKCFMIQIGPGLEKTRYHEEIMNAQIDICEKSEDFVLASKLPAELSGEDMTDKGGIHFTQKALNLIGTDAGTNAGVYVKEQTAQKAEK